MQCIEPVREVIAFVGRHVQPGLAASPEDVFGRLRPFVPDEIIDFPFVQPATKAPPQIMHCAGIPQHVRYQAAVTTCQRLQPVGGQTRIAAA